MNEYGLGTLMDDYVFLEELGRKAGEWGRDIAKSGYGAGQATGSVRGVSMRGRGRGSGRGGLQRTKRDILKTQLELREIDVDMLPSGMERRSCNQSTWDFKYGYPSSMTTSLSDIERLIFTMSQKQDRTSHYRIQVSPATGPYG